MAIFRFKRYIHIKSNLNALSSFASINLNHKSQSGFTLIEYLVAIGILAGLLGVAIFTLDPFVQVERGRDAQKRQDLQQIKNAMETYYQDTTCYPTEIPFGEKWSAGSDVYMTTVPQDPTCNQLNGQCYEYITDTETECPQWGVVFAKLSEVPDQVTTVCPLSSISDTCVPSDYDESWACALAGAVNCELIASTGLYDDSSTPQVSPTPTGPFVVPTLAPGGVTYSLGGGASFNPYLKTMTINPVWPQPNSAQTFLLNAEDSTSDITQVRVRLYSDNQTQQLTLSFVGGTPRDGYWQGTISADTYNSKYTMAIIATNANGNSRCTVLTPGGYVAGPDTICAQINNN